MKRRYKLIVQTLPNTLNIAVLSAFVLKLLQISPNYVNTSEIKFFSRKRVKGHITFSDR